MASNKHLCSLLETARKHSFAPITGYHVGTVVLTDQNEIYLGANIEIMDCGLGQSIHAEQSAIIRVLHKGQAVKKIAVQKAPCAFCRQFMAELHNAFKIEILLPDNTNLSLNELYPLPFHPLDLEISAIPPFNSKWQIVNKEPLNLLEQSVKDLLIKRFSISHSPYTNSPGAVVLQTKSGQIYGGSYFENVAFNPSVEPIRSALVELVHNGGNMQEIVKVFCLKTNGRNVDHVKTMQLFLSTLKNTVEVTTIEVEARSIAELCVTMTN